MLRISSDGDARMEPKVKTQKNPKGFQQNPKNPGPKINAQLKNPMPERGNTITQRKTLEIEHSCLFIHHTI